MMIKSFYISFLTIILVVVVLQVPRCQLIDDFSDGDFSNGVTWFGDDTDFIVNDALELQLSALEAGNSSLFTTVDYPDTISFEMRFLLDMAPSTSNFGHIYIGLDQQDVTLANGYYFQLGESGSNDALKLYRLDAGDETLIATGSIGAIANDPAQARLCITIFPDGLWSVSADYDVNTFCEFEFDVMDDTYSFDDLSIFGFYCQYTESRKENFYFDDISLTKFEQDKTAPNLLEVSVAGSNSLLVTFDEKVDVSSAESVANYIVDNDIGTPTSATADGSKVFMTFDQDFISGIDYTLMVNAVEDLNGNIIMPTSAAFFVTVAPSDGDLKISEILFDPYSGGQDFVEIYNDSEKYINLNGLVISNEDNGQSQNITEDIVILPGQYLCFTEDKDFLIETYPSAVAEQIYLADLPAWNNDSGNVNINHSNATDIIDQYDYSEDFHFVLIDDTEGVSLERISFDIDAQTMDNFVSASSTSGFATPGRENSNRINNINSEVEFSLSSKTFSPNSDGDEDFLIINYNLDKPGYVANIKIFDDEGFERRILSSNALLSTDGFLIWDGTDADGNVSEIGMYIIIGELFHPDGETKNFKMVTVLADFIE